VFQAVTAGVEARYFLLRAKTAATAKSARTNATRDGALATATGEHAFVLLNKLFGELDTA
jgi:hypothetical protein